MYYVDVSYFEETATAAVIPPGRLTGLTLIYQNKFIYQSYETLRNSSLLYTRLPLAQTSQRRGLGLVMPDMRYDTILDGVLVGTRRYERHKRVKTYDGGDAAGDECLQEIKNKNVMSTL